MAKTIRPLVWLLTILLLSGCASTKIPHTLVPEYGKLGMRAIAVLPVADQAADPLVAAMIRAKLSEELYFKGYARIPAPTVDRQLPPSLPPAGDAAAVKALGESLRADAVLTATLNESRRGAGHLMASTVVDASFELRSVRTGERLWQVRHRVGQWNFGWTRKALEMQSSETFESALDELVRRVMETLPDSLEGSGS